MNHKFDELAKGLAQSVTRREAFKKFGLGLAGMALACFAQRSASAATKKTTCYCAVWQNPFNLDNWMYNGTCQDPNGCGFANTPSPSCPPAGTPAKGPIKAAACPGLPNTYYYDTQYQCYC